MVVLSGYKWLEVVPGRRGGRPTIRGTRITVDDVLEALASGWRVEEVAENYGVPLEAIYEALRFASAVVRVASGLVRHGDSTIRGDSGGSG
ncbi:MAG: DUF433 domain-containing protein [Desulfurococcales archaeon]|nr:DUF433 domain-containing protein [Desulfurococcales archaeon]